LVHHKWFIRAILATFWAAEVIANAYGYGFLTLIATNQPLIMFAIVFVTIKYLVEPCYAPFLKLTTNGGETVMDKSTKVMLFVIALAITFSVLMVWDISRTFIVQTFFIDTVLTNGYLAILGFEAWLRTYSPLWVITVTGVATLIFAVLVNTFVRPRIHISTPKIGASQSSSLGSSSTLSQTPSGATLRPSIEEKVDIKEVVAKVKEELVKEEPTTA